MDVENTVSKEKALLALALMLAAGIENEEGEKPETSDKPETPTPSQVEKIKALTAELIKKDKAIEHWKRIAENAKTRGDGYLNEKIILEEKLCKLNNGEESCDRVKELEEENSYLRQAIANAQIELSRLRAKPPRPWDKIADQNTPKYWWEDQNLPEHWWESRPTAGGTD